MRLTIDGHVRDFEPLAGFRAVHGLPADFGVAYFEPKDAEDLGRIDSAGAPLRTLRARIVAAIPTQLSWADLPGFAHSLSHDFAVGLVAINPAVGLRDVEIDYAVAGFSDVLNALVYACFQARHGVGGLPVFPDLYRDWINQSVRVSGTVYPYADWRVQVVHTVYGRVGLIIMTATATHYLAEKQLACPAEGYMGGLLAEVSERILAALPLA